jgi:hypothetical protein
MLSSFGRKQGAMEAGAQASASTSPSSPCPLVCPMEMCPYAIPLLRAPSKLGWQIIL